MNRWLHMPIRRVILLLTKAIILKLLLIEPNRREHLYSFVLVFLADTTWVAIWLHLCNCFNGFSHWGYPSCNFYSLQEKIFDLWSSLHMHHVMGINCSNSSACCKREGGCSLYIKLLNLQSRFYGTGHGQISSQNSQNCVSLCQFILHCPLSVFHVMMLISGQAIRLCRAIWNVCTIRTFWR